MTAEVLCTGSWAVRSGRGRLAGLVIVGALTVLAAVLAFASARHGAVALLYDEAGNGCRALTAASSAQLAQALVPVRILIAAWVVGTGMLAVAPLARSNPAWRRRAVVIGAVGLATLAGAVQLFIGADVLTAFLPLVGLWLIAGPTAAALVVVALMCRRRRVAPWLALSAGWLAVSALALPLILLALTGDGAIRSC